MPLDFTDVTFRYGRRRAPVLERLTFSFVGGATLLLGPNGAGKSTLLGLAATTMRPQAGTIALDGVLAGGRELRRYRRLLAWMPQQVQYVPGLTVREQVAYVGWLKGMSKVDAWSRSLDALRRVGLDGLSQERPRRLSGGQLRRLGIAQVLVHDAKWILMDEPTAGLDPVQRSDFHRLVAALREQMHIVISTHQTEDIDTSYDRVVVLDRGRVQFAGTTAEFLLLGGEQAPLSQAVVDAYRRTLAPA